MIFFYQIAPQVSGLCLLRWQVVVEQLGKSHGCVDFGIVVVLEILQADHHQPTRHYGGDQGRRDTASLWRRRIPEADVRLVQGRGEAF